MKKLLMMVIAAMMATVSVNAQNEWKNEAGIAYGSGSNTDLISSLYKGIFTGKQSGYFGPVSLEYFNRPFHNNRWGFGVVATMGICDWDDSDDAKTTFFTIMPAVKFNWSVKEKVSWYSKLALGVLFASDSGIEHDSDDDTSNTAFNFQMSLVGVEIGSAFRVFGELGFGEQGIILGGLRYKF